MIGGSDTGAEAALRVQHHRRGEDLRALMRVAEAEPGDQRQHRHFHHQKGAGQQGVGLDVENGADAADQHGEHAGGRGVELSAQRGVQVGHRAGGQHRRHEQRGAEDKQVGLQPAQGAEQALDDAVLTAGAGVCGAELGIAQRDGGGDAGGDQKRQKGAAAGAGDRQRGDDEDGAGRRHAGRGDHHHVEDAEIAFEGVFRGGLFHWELLH